MFDEFNIENITNFNQGVEVIEKNFINPVLKYLAERELGLGYDNKKFTKSYM
jgi:hypothetical protein